MDQSNDDSMDDIDEPPDEFDQSFNSYYQKDKSFDN